VRAARRAQHRGGSQVGGRKPTARSITRSPAVRGFARRHEAAKVVAPERYESGKPASRKRGRDADEDARTVNVAVPVHVVVAVKVHDHDHVKVNVKVKVNDHDHVDVGATSTSIHDLPLHEVSSLPISGERH